MADINITLSIPSAGLNGGLGGAGGADNLNSGLGNNGLSGKKSTAQENQLLEALAVVLTALLPSLLNNNGAQGGGAGNALGGGQGNGLGGQGNGLSGGLDNGLGSGSGDGLGASGGQGQNGLTDMLTKLLDLLMPKDGAQGGQGNGLGGGLGGAGGSGGASGAQGTGGASGAGGAGGAGGLEDLSKSLLQDTGENSLGNGISPTQDGGGQISDNPLLKILLALVALLMESQKNQFGQPQGGAGGGNGTGGGAPVSGGSSTPTAGNATAAGGGAAPEIGGIAAAGASNNASELADGKGQAGNNSLGLTPTADAVGADTGKTTV
ncbi:type III effector protein [Dickeya dianthicola]|uniref:type III effector protein n=1 Tax=Dickeya dianthicola TaxID=204039 RepID=UPI001F616F95|nr:type III effector protein [Dickeya dianthicola]MCI4223061.1 type III effector protein [Dickeya dianthicola]